LGILGWIIAIGLWINVVAMLIPWKKQPIWRRKIHLGIGVFLGFCFILKLMFQ